VQDPAPGPLAEGRPEAGVVQSGNAHYDTVIEMLRGKAPGVQIIETTPGQIEIRIRGMNQSLQAGGQEPLVVIDGAASGRPAGQALLALNPDDVQRIEVLKDVGSTSVYGTRGANGVILVTTKRREAPRP
jgi:TonB-dependent SusC/RagA subfamily outer membrane receptor